MQGLSAMAMAAKWRQAAARPTRQRGRALLLGGGVLEGREPVAGVNVLEYRAINFELTPSVPPLSL